MRQWNCFECLNILNFSKILKCSVFKIFDFPFLSLNIITGQRNFLCLADRLLERTPEIKNDFEHFFHCEIWKLILLNFALRILSFAVESHRWKGLSSLCLSVGWDFFPSFLFTFSLSPYLLLSHCPSLSFLNFLLMPHFSCCFVAWCHLLASLTVNYRNVLFSMT